MDVSIWTWSIFSGNLITSFRYRLSMAFLFASRELSNFDCILAKTCFHSIKSKMAAQWCHSTLWVSPTSTPLRSKPTYYTGTKFYNFSFLAHGDSYGSLANRFRWGHQPYMVQYLRPAMLSIKYCSWLFWRSQMLLTGQGLKEVSREDGLS